MRDFDLGGFDAIKPIFTSARGHVAPGLVVASVLSFGTPSDGVSTFTVADKRTHWQTVALAGQLLIVVSGSAPGEEWTQQYTNDQVDRAAELTTECHLAASLTSLTMTKPRLYSQGQFGEPQVLRWEPWRLVVTRQGSPSSDPVAEGFLPSRATRRVLLNPCCPIADRSRRRTGVGGWSTGTP